eukprot:scaffold11426_cov139-Isochrysis_galbana.AAC.1
MSVGEHVRKVVSEASLPKQDTFPKGLVGRGVFGESESRGGEDGSGNIRVAASAALVSERRQGLSPCLRLVVGVWRQRVPSGTSGRRRAVQGRVCGARAAAMLAHTVSLGVGMLRGLLERAILLFSIVDLMSVNGAAFRQVRVACETHTGVF